MKPALTKEFVDYMTDKKRNSRKMYHLLGGTGHIKQAERLLTCCDEMTLGDDGKFFRTYFCESHFCPICTWKKSRETYQIIKELVRRMSKYFGFLFCTLTIKNCKGSELKDYCSKLLAAGARFVGSSSSWSHFKAFRGGFRSLEITYNEATDTYHPHLHYLIAVPRVYFNRKKNKGLWVSRDEAFEYYKRCIGEEFLDLDLVNVGAFDFRCVYNKPSKEFSSLDYSSAIAEVAKYTLKDINLYKLLDKNPDRAYNVFGHLYEALFRRQTTSFFGIMSDYKRDFDKEEKNFYFIQLGDGDSFSSFATFEYGLSNRYCYRSSIRFARSSDCLLPCNINYYDYRHASILGHLPPVIDRMYKLTAPYNYYLTS